MGHGSILAVEALVTQQNDALIGVTDLLSVQTANGAVLFTASRGGGWVTAFEIGMTAGDARVRSEWQIPSEWLQLETTDMVFRDGVNGYELLLAGLNGTDMLALQLPETVALSSFDGTRIHTSTSNDLGALSEIAALDGQGHVLGGLRMGGLVQAQFSDSGQVSMTQLDLPPALQNAQVSALDSIVYSGMTYAIAAFGNEDALALLVGSQGGALSLQNTFTANTQLPFDRPSATVMVEVDGNLYAIAAASGTGSLTVFQINPMNGEMTAVDHVFDTRETRFENVTFLKAITFGSETYLVAAGSDQGLTLMSLLPGGELHALDSIEGSIDLPLDNITDIELAITGSALRIWVSTISAPYLLEFTVDLSTQGGRLLANAAGGTLSGTDNSDTIWGDDGDDQLLGGAGDDILRDGAGSDVLSGGAGADTFVFVSDGVRDTITDFQVGLDQIDLTRLEGLRDLSDVQIISRAWGAELRFGAEVIEVYSADGNALNASDLNLSGFVTGLDRILLDTTIVFPPVDPTGQTATNGDDLLLGGAGDDTLDGMVGNDQISGRGGNDYLLGRGGDDTLVGGDGADTIYGGDGNDIIYGDSTTSFDWV
ncbi:MAG: M10 family metallopeptidase C-terminal domain-containing protein [Sulfitobacter sp.]